MNRIFSEQLKSRLSQRFSLIYLLVGQEPLLLGESQDLIVQSANAQGFDERVSIKIDNNTDWIALFEQCQSLGLFFTRQIIHLELPDTLTAAQQNKLNELLDLWHHDLLFVFQFNKLAKNVEKQLWFTRLSQIEPNVTLINCQTPTLEQLPRWVEQRVKNLGLQIDDDSVQLLCYSYENNLLALKQSLDLLALLYPDNVLNYARVKNIVEQASVFTPFQWIDALLLGKEKRALRILQGLQAEDVVPVILLRTAQRELMTLLELSKPQQNHYDINQSLPTANLRADFDRLKIWQNRRPLFITAVQRLTLRKLFLLIQKLAELERCAKDEFNQDIWDQLEQFSLQFCR